MKSHFLAGALILVVAIVHAETPALIPLPQKMELQEGIFHLSPETKIITDGSSHETGEFLAERLRKSTGFPFGLGTNDSAVAGIVLTTKNAGTNLGAEGYSLTVATNSVTIRALTSAGLFYGAQTLLQLFPPEIFSARLVTNAAWQMPCVQIEDWPRFQWRGLMLDVSRHFFDKTEVEKILDEMAVHKLNTFHWHLTDDQGWRIEIKKYPKLTEVGAWRARSELGASRRQGANGQEAQNAHPDWAKVASSKIGADGRYGGFYTQDEIREVVAYAAARHISVVPEIEMPGHAVAALAAYPEYSCDNAVYSTDVRAGVNPGIYSAGNEETYVFQENILREVFQLFPGKYIHIGGDEVRTNQWQQDPKEQALMQREGMKDANEVESYFIRRMEKFINSQGRTLIGWTEIVHGGLATNAVVMDWKGGGLEAASAGHDVVMAPQRYCYVDHYQSTNHSTEPRAIGGFLPVETVYAFEPIPPELAPALQSHVLGGQCNLWTEYVASLPHVEYMFFPRACALAEATWSAKAARDFGDFSRRLKIHELRLGELGVNYRGEGKE